MAAGDYSEQRLGRQQHFQMGTVSVGDLSKMAGLHSLAMANVHASNKFDQNRKERSLPSDRATNSHAANRLVQQRDEHTKNMKVTRKSEFTAASTLKPSLGREALQ